MAYLRRLRNREGKIYYHIAESYREKDRVNQRTLERIGRHDQMLANGIANPEQAAREAVAEFNANRRPFKITKTVATHNESPQSLLGLGYQLPLLIYSELGISQVVTDYTHEHKFTYDLDHILKVLVLGRLLGPCSKSRTNEQFRQTLAPTITFRPDVISPHDLFRSLDHITELKDTLQHQIHQSLSASTGRTGQLVFYDVTNYYFESDLGDPDILDNGEVTYLNKTQLRKQGIPPSSIQTQGLRKRGPSKEYRHDPIVQLGLFMDTNGIPISYELFPGNQTDPITYVPAMEQMKRQFGIERAITVADKAMNNQQNILAALERGDGWVFSQKLRGGKRGSPTPLQQFVLDSDGWEFDESRTIGVKSTIRERTLRDSNNGKSQIVQEKVLVVWRKTYEARERLRRDGALGYASALTEPEVFRQTMRKGGKRFLKLEYRDPKTKQLIQVSPHFGLDLERVDWEAQFDGMNVIVTSEINMEDEEIIATYGQLGKIEDCFRASKFNLKTRPVYVWTKEHIEAHFLICFIALVILRLLQHRLDNKYSPARIIEALNSIQGQPWAQGYWQIFQNTDAKEILEVLGLPKLYEYMPAEIVQNLTEEKPRRLKHVG